MKNKIDWIVDQTYKNSLFILECSNKLEQQTTFLMNMLITAAGASLAFSIHLQGKDSEPWLIFGMVAVTCWLFLITSILVIKCMWSKPIYGPASDPKNLLLAKDFLLAEIIEFDLENRQYAIEANRKRNDSIGKWLNISRGLTITTPILFLIGAIFSVC